MTKVTLEELKTIYEYTDGHWNRDDVGITLVHADQRQVNDLLGYIVFSKEHLIDPGMIAATIGHDLGILRNQILNDEDDGSTPRSGDYAKFLPPKKIQVRFVIEVPVNAMTWEGVPLDDPSDLGLCVQGLIEDDEQLGDLTIAQMLVKKVG